MSSADYVKGFGGKFGVQTDRQDKCALGWDHQEKPQLHESQKGASPAAFRSSALFTGSVRWASRYLGCSVSCLPWGAGRVPVPPSALKRPLRL